MNGVLPVLILGLAAVLEAGGDAVVRAGLGLAGTLRIAAVLAGGLVLLAYGVVVNAPSWLGSGWDFGRLLGVYVVLFFVAAQVINRVAFGIPPSLSILAGGALIVAGGAVMTVWR